jgi:hypothetical protein
VRRALTRAALLAFVAHLAMLALGLAAPTIGKLVIRLARHGAAFCAMERVTAPIALVAAVAGATRYRRAAATGRSADAVWTQCQSGTAAAATR